VTAAEPAEGSGFDTAPRWTDGPFQAFTPVHDGPWSAHEAGCYESDESLVALALPFLAAAAEAGEPALTVLGPAAGAALRDVLPADARVTHLPNSAVYARPALAVREIRRLLAENATTGASGTWLLSELPAERTGSTWDWWARYEATVNHAYRGFPLHTRCLYDTRRFGPDVLSDVARTHPELVDQEGPRPSPAYQGAEAFLRQRRPLRPDPLQAGPPRADLTNPMPGEVRAAICADPDSPLTDTAVADLTVAVSEVATNAIRHGRPPLRVRVWSGAGRLVVAVTDQGDGPPDPYTGLLPARHAPDGGLGLWLAFQLCDHVAFGPTPEGFTIRLTAGLLP
jgi:hypothetical protein